MQTAAGAPGHPKTPWLPTFSGHRVATWLLAWWTLGVLLSAAFGWSVVAVGSTHGTPLAAPSWYGCGLFVAVVSFLFLAARNHFRIVMIPVATSRSMKIVASVTMAACMLIILIAFLPVRQPTYGLVAGLVGALSVAGFLADVVGSRVLREAWLRGRLRENALIYGSDRLAAELAVEIDLRPEFGLDVVGFVATDRQSREPFSAPVYDVCADLDRVVADTKAHRLIIGPGTAVTDRHALRLARRAAAVGMPVFVVPRLFEMGLGVDLLAPDRARGYPLVRLQRSAHPQLSIRLKRFFDLVVASSGLVVLSPVILVVALLVRLTSPGPVLYCQERVGQYERRIIVRKFRSMYQSDTSDQEWTADHRVTPLGVWLRRLNLDELPQLWSVVAGEMSLVGPRPERPDFVEDFRRRIPDYDDRHRMPVGITGLAQIVGLRGNTSIAERVKYDNLYIDQWSFRSDLHILIKTVSAIVTQRSDATRAVALEQALAGVAIDLTDPRPAGPAFGEVSALVADDEPGGRGPLPDVDPDDRPSPFGLTG